MENRQGDPWQLLAATSADANMVVIPEVRGTSYRRSLSPRSPLDTLRISRDKHTIKGQHTSEARLKFMLDEKIGINAPCVSDSHATGWFRVSDYD